MTQLGRVAFLAPAGLAVPLAILGAELVLAWSYRNAFAPMLAATAQPRAALSEEPQALSPAE